MISNRGIFSVIAKKNLMNFGRRGLSTKPYVLKDATRFVKDGKRIQVGLWLIGTSSGKK